MLPILADGGAVVRLAGILEFFCGHSRTFTWALASLGREEGQGMLALEPEPLWSPRISAPAPRGAPRPFPACQSNPALGSSSVAKRKQISKHTSARCFPPSPSRPLLQAPQGSDALACPRQS